MCNWGPCHQVDRGALIGGGPAQLKGKRTFNQSFEPAVAAPRPPTTVTTSLQHELTPQNSTATTHASRVAKEDKGQG